MQHYAVEMHHGKLWIALHCLTGSEKLGFRRREGEGGLGEMKAHCLWATSKDIYFLSCASLTTQKNLHAGDTESLVVCG